MLVSKPQTLKGDGGEQTPNRLEIVVRKNPKFQASLPNGSTSYKLLSNNGQAENHVQPRLNPLAGAGSPLQHI